MIGSVGQRHWSMRRPCCISPSVGLRSSMTLGSWTPITPAAAVRCERGGVPGGDAAEPRRAAAGDAAAATDPSRRPDHRHDTAAGRRLGGGSAAVGRAGRQTRGWRDEPAREGAVGKLRRDHPARAGRSSGAGAGAECVVARGDAASPGGSVRPFRGRDGVRLAIPSLHPTRCSYAGVQSPITLVWRLPSACWPRLTITPLRHYFPRGRPGKKSRIWRGSRSC